MSQPIYQVGVSPIRKQAARRPDGQWFYRVKQKINVPGSNAKRFNGWGRWVPCNDRPDGAWYDPQYKGRAYLPND